LTGSFVEKVKNRGEYDNTVIVYASDHGDMLGDHGKWGKGTWRDPAVRIPLIVRNPFSSYGELVNSETGVLYLMEDTNWY